MAPFYNHEKLFVKSLAAKLAIRSGRVHVGVVTFASHAELPIKFNQHKSTALFNDAIDSLKFLNGKSARIDLGFRKVERELFSTENGARDDVARMVVLVTASAQTRKNGAGNPARIAEEMRKNGAHVIMIGVGDGVDTAELEEMAGDRGSVFKAASFSELTTRPFVGKISLATCGKFRHVKVKFGQSMQVIKR